MAQSDNIPAMLQSGEYVVRKEAVEKLGKDTMDMINNVDRLGYMGGGLVPQGEHGHSAIDELLALNTLVNQRSVDMTRDSAMMNKGGKALKKAPEGNKGLMKLPQEVRNRMGYMKEGGEVQDNTATNIMNLLALNDIIERAPQYSMFDADSRGGVLSDEDILGISEGNFMPAAGILGKGYAGIFGSGDVSLSKIKKLLMSDRFNRGGEGSMLRQLSKQSPTMSDFVRNVSRTGNEELADEYARKLIKEARDVYKKAYQEGGMMDNYMYGGMPKKKKKKGYEDGGSVGVVNEIGKARKMFSDIDDLLATAALMDNYTFGPMQRKALRSMREADMVDPKDTMEQVMMLLKAREQNKIPSFEKRKSYIMGGSAGGGSQTGFDQPSTSDYFQEIYEAFGFIPSDAGIREDFEKRFAYDPTKAVGDIASLTEEATGQLGSIVQQSQQVGGGFEGFGERQRGIEEARSDLYRMVEEGAEGITEESKLAQQEEAILDLARREEAGAEFDTMKPGPPDMPSGFLRAGSRRNMADGVYMWTGSRWMGPA